MKDVLLYNLNAGENLVSDILKLLNCPEGELKVHRFPDGETAVQVLTPPLQKKCVVVAELKNPDSSIMALYFLCKALKENGASHVLLVAPYLPYMRQDKAFNEGDVITSKYFAHLISGIADALITVDPHLHRWKSLAEIYSIPAHAISATGLITNYIKTHIDNAVLIGPDSESRQWVSVVAAQIDRPYAVLEKIRHGDADVEIHYSDFDACKNGTPVLIDDIVSTASTMIKTTEQIIKSGLAAPVCIGVHAVFAGSAFQNLMHVGVKDVITSNTIVHPSNKINVAPLIAESIMEILS